VASENDIAFLGPKGSYSDQAASEYTGESIPAIIADAAAKTGRPRTDFEVEEISRKRYEKLKQFLG
jgi:prephenate dehydratase